MIFVVETRSCLNFSMGIIKDNNTRVKHVCTVELKKQTTQKVNFLFYFNYSRSHSII